MVKKYREKPIEDRKTSGEYLKTNDNSEAKKIVELAKDLPHLKKPIKYILKN